MAVFFPKKFTVTRTCDFSGINRVDNTGDIIQLIIDDTDALPNPKRRGALLLCNCHRLVKSSRLPGNPARPGYHDQRN